MNKDQAKGQFNQIKGEIKKTWAKLTDDDVAYLDGEKDKFYGRVQELHGDVKDVAEKKVNAMQADYDAKNGKNNAA